MRHISDAYLRARQEIIDRKAGKIRPLSTGWSNLDKAIGGIEWGRIYVIAGLSGTGKSTMLEQLKRNIFEYNSNTSNIKILSFDFEMLPEDQLIRAASSATGISHGDILSYWSKLDDVDLSRVDSYMNKISKYPIYIVDTSMDPTTLARAIEQFIESQDKNDSIIVTIDNLSFIDGPDDKSAIDATMKKLVALKKKYAEIGRKVSFIVISQLNRNLEEDSRIFNPSLHYPTKRDIYATSAIYFSADVIIITHKPAVIPGMGDYYGPPKKGFIQGLPVYNPLRPEQAMIYWHIIKQRFGQNGILMMVDNLDRGRIDQFNPKEC